MGNDEDHGRPSRPVRRARPGLIDATVPNPARTADYLHGGQAHFAADRAVMRAITASVPAVARIPAETLAFRRRVVRYLAAEAGLRQFLDIGAGLIPPGTTHETAQAVDPSCRVFYTDSDPAVLGQARARLTSASSGAVQFELGDIADVDAILTEAKAVLDLSQPTAVLLLPTLVRVPTLVAAARAVSSLLAAVPTGSYIAISHLASDLHPAMAEAARTWNRKVAAPVTPRSRADMQSLVAALEVVPPGVVPVTEWRPEAGADDGPAALVPLYGVLARKP
jgi:S-adenosyl methyltransferase